MALDFETLEAAIKDWFVTVLDLPATWENNRRAFMGKFPVYGVLGEPTDIVELGTDWVQETTKKIVSVAITAADSETYTITINGVDFIYVSDSDATTAEIAAGLVAAINAGNEPVAASGTDTPILIQATIANPEGAFTYQDSATGSGDLVASIIDNLTQEVVGSRLFTVPIRLIGRSHTSARSARNHAEMLRVSLKKPSTLEFFKENGIAVVRAGAIANFDVEFDGRMESIAAFDLRLCAALTPDADAGGGTIGTIELSSNVKNADGTVLPVPPNLDEFIIEVDP